MTFGSAATTDDANSNSATLDLTGDGAVDSGDVEAWLGDAGAARGFTGPIRRGDVDFNGIVDASDLNVVGINWQRMDVASWTEGDFDNDGKVAAGDLNGLGVNWLTDITVAPMAATAVPEPASRMMVLVGLLALTFALLILLSLLSLLSLLLRAFFHACL